MDIFIENTYYAFYSVYDLMLSRRQDSIKSSRAINRIRRIKEIDVSRTISVFIIRDMAHS
jgi:hypothetical protein